MGRAYAAAMLARAVRSMKERIGRLMLLGERLLGNERLEVE